MDDKYALHEPREGQTMATKSGARNAVNAFPTKAFFVEMLVRDIPLEQAVLDLVDNCIDGAKRMNGSDFQGRKVEIKFDKKHFRILDNCGGFGINLATKYAFRFGRPPGTPKTPNSIGQFGVGMKRALFKFGRGFVVRSATKNEKWAVKVNVDKWEKDETAWSFNFSDFGDESGISTTNPGTDVLIYRLRPEVALRFATQQFENGIVGLIKSKHRQFIISGLAISVNDTHLTATNVFLLETSQLKPGVDVITFGRGRADRVKVRIKVGLGGSSPREAGWYVLCNGRVILEHDRRNVTGWGLMEIEDERMIIPTYHNQFARFRGIVSFDSRDAALLPWNTTKTDVDQDNPIWQKTFQRMIEMMRPVIDFLNELDKDIDEYTRDGSPLLDHVMKASQTRVESLTRKSEFRAPRRGALKKAQKTVAIQYSKPLKDVQYLQEILSMNSAKRVGERTFDIVLKKHKGK